MKLTGITVEEKAVVMVGATCGRAEHAESLMWVGSTGFSLVLFSSRAALRPLWCGCPGLSIISE